MKYGVQEELIIKGHYQDKIGLVENKKGHNYHG